LRSGSLQVLLDAPILGEEGYFLVYPEAKAGLPSVVAFRDWILAECGLDNASASRT
jgi:LysR family transcriptional regulator, glycine cleavage system transcriptional activator